MLKRDELSDPNSCLNKAQDDEIVFVLVERDPTAAHIIRKWARERVRQGLNVYSDPKIKEAMTLANVIDVRRATK